MGKKSKIGIVILVFLVLIQFIRIDKTNPPVQEDKDFVKIYNTPESTQTILKNACYDCHSNETKYAWYSNVAPISWWTKSHINGGREHLNFSEFGDYNNNQKSHVLEEAIEVVENGKMPMRSYVLMHSEAELSTEDKSELFTYFKSIISQIEAE